MNKPIERKVYQVVVNSHGFGYLSTSRSTYEIKKLLTEWSEKTGKTDDSGNEVYEKCDYFITNQERIRSGEKSDCVVITFTSEDCSNLRGLVRTPLALVAWLYKQLKLDFQDGMETDPNSPIYYFSFS